MLALAVLALSLDEVAGVEPFGSTNQCGNNLGTESFTITHDGILRFLAEVVDEVHTKIDALQLLEEGINRFE